MPARADAIMQLLSELEQWMQFENCPPIDLVVCGGAALNLLQLLDRPTRDVDVLARWDDAAADLAMLEKLPDAVIACVRQVAARHPELAGTSTTWLNLGPRALVGFGLPEGFCLRLQKLTIGPRLTLRLPSRWDLLALKLYAASDDFGPRQEIHFADLANLKPRFDELDRAVQWLRTLPDFEQLQPAVKEVCKRLGYDDLAY